MSKDKNKSDIGNEIGKVILYGDSFFLKSSIEFSYKFILILLDKI